MFVDLQSRLEDHRTVVVVMIEPDDVGASALADGSTVRFRAELDAERLGGLGEAELVQLGAELRERARLVHDRCAQIERWADGQVEFVWNGGTAVLCGWDGQTRKLTLDVDQAPCPKALDELVAALERARERRPSGFSLFSLRKTFDSVERFCRLTMRPDGEHFALATVHGLSAHVAELVEVPGDADEDQVARALTQLTELVFELREQLEGGQVKLRRRHASDQVQVTFTPPDDQLGDERAAVTLTCALDQVALKLFAQLPDPAGGPDWDAARAAIERGARVDAQR